MKQNISFFKYIFPAKRNTFKNNSKFKQTNKKNQPTTPQPHTRKADDIEALIYFIYLS